MSRRIVFEKVSLKGVKQWTDSDGKKRQKTQHFFQTLSPFNTNPDGSAKSYDQVMVELKRQRAEWLKGEQP